MTPSKEETYHLLSISRFGTTSASKPTVNALLGRKLIAHRERPGGGCFADRYTLTDAGFDAMYDSPHFEAARVRLDADGRADSESDYEESEA